MKTTGENTRMIQIAPGEWAHVRGDVLYANLQKDERGNPYIRGIGQGGDWS